MFAHYLQRRCKLNYWTVRTLFTPYCLRNHCVISCCADSFIFIVFVLPNKDSGQNPLCCSSVYEELKKGYPKNEVTLKLHTSKARTIYLDHTQNNTFSQVPPQVLKRLWRKPEEEANIFSIIFNKDTSGGYGYFIILI